MIQIRKSLAARFSRLNLSRSGAGISAGIRGLRMGAGPGGPYLSAGLRGIFFRHSLSSTSTVEPKNDGEEETMTTTASMIFIIALIVAICSVFGIITGILLLAIVG